MSRTVTASLSFDEASKMERERTLLGWLTWRGIDPRRMAARREGDRIVYEGAPLSPVNSDASATEKA